MNGFIEMLECRRCLSAPVLDVEDPACGLDFSAGGSAAEVEADGPTDSGGDISTPVDDSNEGESQAAAADDTGTEADSERGCAGGAAATTDSASTAAATSVRTAAAALLKLVGKYTGTVVIPGVAHVRTVTVSIGKQGATGKFKGTLIPTIDTTIRVTISGKLAANRKFTITLKGTHSGGAINGTGTGTVSANGKTLKATLTFTQSGQHFPGSLSLKKA